MTYVMMSLMHVMMILIHVIIIIVKRTKWKR